MQSIFSAPHLKLLEASLKTTSLRHKVISDNIANVNTPNYKSKQVAFEEQLITAISRSNNQYSLSLTTTNQNHISSSTTQDVLNPMLQMNSTTTLRKDGNNVDIDAEMANLAKNSIKYQAVAQQISRYFTQLKSAIDEGRK